MEVRIMNEEIAKALRARFKEKDSEEIIAFLNRGFDADNAQIAIASIFFYADKEGIPPERVLIECEKEFKRNWDFQHPEIKGDTLAPGGAGKQNIVSLNNIYEALNIRNPALGDEIPSRAFVAKTRNSVYRFGELGEKGSRTISRDGNPIGFSLCRIKFFAKGKDMVIEPLDGPEPSDWITTPIVSIS